jgi:hypothetical protein
MFHNVSLPLSSVYNTEAVGIFETLSTTLQLREKVESSGFLRNVGIYITLRGLTSEKTIIVIVSVVRTSNLMTNTAFPPPFCIATASPLPPVTSVLKFSHPVYGLWLLLVLTEGRYAMYARR